MEINIRKGVTCVARHKIYDMAFASVYPHYVTKVEKKGRTKDELHEVMTWLTGYDEAGLQQVLDKQVSFEDFFAQAPDLNPNRKLITGVICGIRVENIEAPLMQEIRYLDKVVDELAKGKPLNKIMRK